MHKLLLLLLLLLLSPSYLVLGVNGTWAAWSMWTACNAHGKKMRSRDCVDGGAECARATELETRDCYSPGCPGMLLHFITVY